MKKENKNWEEEWDRIAPAEVESNGITYDLRPIMIPLKEFVRSITKIERKWAMPSRHTFKIKPIRELLNQYVHIKLAE